MLPCETARLMLLGDAVGLLTMLLRSVVMWLTGDVVAVVGWLDVTEYCPPRSGDRLWRLKTAVVEVVGGVQGRLKVALAEVVGGVQGRLKTAPAAVVGGVLGGVVRKVDGSIFRSESLSDPSKQREPLAVELNGF